MKVALLGLKGDFSKNTGMGIRRYMYELYNKMHKIRKGINNPGLHWSLSLPILEAQSRGLPVIIYKYDKIPDGVRKYFFKANSLRHLSQIINYLMANYNNENRKKVLNLVKNLEKTLFTYYKVSL